MFHLIESKRLLLEPITKCHAVELFEGLRDVELYDFIPKNPPESLATLEARYTMLSTGKSPDGSELWLNWVLRLNDSGVAVGMVEFTLTPPDTGILAYTVLRQYWGQGYATEGCRSAISHVRATFESITLFAYIDTRNARSVRVAKSLGFSFQELIRNADTFKGTTSDEFIYSLISTNSLSLPQSEESTRES